MIYHLHTRNEDHDFELQELTEQYEAEVQAGLREADAKLQQQAAALSQEKQAACEELQAQVSSIASPPTAHSAPWHRH